VNAGWKTAKLGSLFETTSGGTPLSTIKAFYDGGSIPWIMSGEVCENVKEATRFITEVGLSNSSAKIFPKRTVLVAMYGATAGEVGILNIEACTNQAVCGILPNQNYLPRFLYFLLLWHREALVSQATGNAQPNISQAKIRDLDIPVIGLSEQKRIVAILDEAFEGIATARANAENCLLLSLSASEQYRDGFFFTCASKNAKSLGEIASFRNGVNFTKSSRGRRVKIVGVKDFKDRFSIPADDLETVTIDGEINGEDLLKKGDLLTVRSNGSAELIGRTMVADDQPAEALHSGFTIRTRLSAKNVLPEYVCHFMRSGETRKRLMDGGTGVNIKSLNQSTLANLVIPLPPVVEQKVIVSKLDQLFTNTVALQDVYKRKITALDALKQSLLHQAFTGKL
jgi:type I restriction enzyme S subunit